jgi:O-antigen ligase
LHESWEDLSRSLRWLYAGLALALFWGTVQLPILVLGSSFYYRAVNFIQRFISTRKLFTTRISGLTFEPKWFAEQICFLFLPWLITSVLMNRSSFRWRWHRITIELILLVWSVVILIFTFSRTGVFILIVLTFVGYLLFHFRFHKKTPRLQKSMHRRILEASAIVLVLSAVLVIIGAQNPYFSRLWRYWTEAKTRNRTYLEFIAVEQRFVYTETALRIYDVNPWLGVGLGNYAFYFTEKLPNHPWSTQREIIRQITPGEGRDRLITPKNLIARLIAETGILGTGSFATFVLGVVGSALYLWFSPTVEQKYWGLGAALAMLVFAFAIFSFDSFALPNMWIVFGLITSAAHLPDPGSPPGAVEIVQPNID